MLTEYAVSIAGVVGAVLGYLIHDININTGSIRRWKRRRRWRPQPQPNSLRPKRTYTPGVAPIPPAGPSATTTLPELRPWTSDDATGAVAPPAQPGARYTWLATADTHDWSRGVWPRPDGPLTPPPATQAERADQLLALANARLDDSWQEDDS